MSDDFNLFYQNILQTEVGAHVHPNILQQFAVTSCLVLNESKELYQVSDNTTGAKGILRITKDAAGEDALAEYRILSSLNHPAVPKVLYCMQAGGQGYLVREYFEGPTLAERVAAAGVLTAEEILRLLGELCGILSYLHSRVPPVIHRDIKPENIILAPDGSLKLIDFGIARQFKEEATQDTRMMGTRPYMAPEQFGSEQTDARADVFSLGVLAVFLATGRPDRENLKKTYPYKALLPVIRKCVRKDPAHRFRSAEKLRKRLRWVQKKRGKKLALSAVAAACALAVGVAGFFVGRGVGFDEGKAYLLSGQAPVRQPPRGDDLYKMVDIREELMKFAVYTALNKLDTDPSKPYETQEQKLKNPVYVHEVLKINEIKIYGNSIYPAMVDINFTKRHAGRSDVQYYTDNGLPLSPGTLSTLDDAPVMYNLRRLTCAWQNIADLSPLTGMELEKLVVCGNNIPNLLPIQDMTTLRELDAADNPLGAIDPLSKLRSLAVLDISQTQVSDLKPLRNLTLLTGLQINYIDATDLAAVGELKNLQTLGMRGVKAKSWGFLEGLGSLAELDVSDCGLTGAPPVLPALYKLDLSDNPLTDLTAVAALPNLQWLNVSDTPLTDLTPLLDRASTGTLTLYADGVPVAALEAVRGQAGINIVDATGW